MSSSSSSVNSVTSLGVTAKIKNSDGSYSSLVTTTQIEKERRLQEVQQKLQFMILDLLKLIISYCDDTRSLNLKTLAKIQKSHLVSNPPPPLLEFPVTTALVTRGPSKEEFVCETDSNHPTSYVWGQYIGNNDRLQQMLCRGTYSHNWVMLPNACEQWHHDLFIFSTLDGYPDYSTGSILHFIFAPRHDILTTQNSVNYFLERVDAFEDASNCYISDVRWVSSFGAAPKKK